MLKFLQIIRLPKKTGKSICYINKKEIEKEINFELVKEYKPHGDFLFTRSPRHPRRLQLASRLKLCTTPFKYQEESIPATPTRSYEYKMSKHQTAGLPFAVRAVSFSTAPSTGRFKIRRTRPQRATKYHTNNTTQMQSRQNTQVLPNHPLAIHTHL